MPIKLRKDGPMTADDLDNNFIELERMCEDAKKQLEFVMEELARLRIGSGSLESQFHLKISEDNGVELHVPGLNLKGEFKTEGEYIPGDFVYHDHSFWFAVAKSEAGEWNISNWRCIFKFPVENEK